MADISLHDSWKAVLASTFEQPYMRELKTFIMQQKQQGQEVYPPGREMFNALDSTPFDQVKVVILGQDPYHGPNQAHGLCFSVNKGVPIPPSLRNIYQELHQDIGFDVPSHGNLQSWADQGVLLLNSVLTVNRGQAASHQGKGWETFTDTIISELNRHHSHLVYLLWGAYAQKKGKNIDANQNLILQSVHPSPLSAHRGFLGCRHFSQCNAYLESQGKTAVDWQIR